MARIKSTAAGKGNFYRCPACGAGVDNALLEEVRLHHDHVLHPDRYSPPASTGTRPPTNPKELVAV